MTSQTKLHVRYLVILFLYYSHYISFLFSYFTYNNCIDIYSNQMKYNNFFFFTWYQNHGRFELWFSYVDNFDNPFDHCISFQYPFDNCISFGTIKRLFLALVSSNSLGISSVVNYGEPSNGRVSF